jgi:hypothetical protein
LGATHDAQAAKRVKGRAWLRVEPGDAMTPFARPIAIAAAVCAAGPPLAGLPPASSAEALPTAPIILKPGPHLFIDDHLIAESRNVARKVNSPKRDLPGPVVTGPEDKNFQPYVTVLRDPQTRRFRMWYGTPVSANQSHLATIESEDGVRWIRPHRVLEDAEQIDFGASVIDEGPNYPDLSKRYKFGWWNDGGLKIAASPDGYSWKMLKPGVALEHNHDINSIHRDPIRKQYIAMVSSYTTGPTWQGRRRCTMQSVSRDLIHWEKPWFIVTPDDAKDPGETQFYCMSGLLARGDLLIGTLKVLRDDLPADPGGPVAGIGYTVLAWSRDGRTWTRDREPFLDRHPEKGQWDHAMSWIDCQLPVGDEVYLYYGGYKQGHKVDRFTERQIGLVRMRRDRYVAREAGPEPGTLRTPLLTLGGRRITLNADAAGGEIRAQLLDREGKPIPGFTFEDCRPISADTLDAALEWKRRLGRLNGAPVRLEFRLRNARLYALNVE